MGRIPLAPYVEDGRCRLVSRNGNEFKSFPALNVALPLECRAKRAVLDGEIVCLDKRGNSQFRDLLFRRGEPRFYAFDLLSCNGEDLRYLPLTGSAHFIEVDCECKAVAGITPISPTRNSQCR